MSNFTRQPALALRLLESRIAPAVGDLIMPLAPHVGAGLFGHAIAATTQFVAVGATASDVGGVSAGAVDLYNAATGAFLRTLNNPSPNASDFFGKAVAIAGDTVVVGAPQDDTDGLETGIAYVFSASTGALLHTLHNPTPIPGTSENYGEAVAVTGDLILVGAYLDGTDGPGGGSVYKFNRTTGTFIDRLVSPNPEGGDQFGISLAATGSLIAVGAGTDELPGGPFSNSGGVHLYTAAGVYLRSVYDPVPGALNFFGSSVGLAGNTLVVGARTHLAAAGTTRPGSAYVFNASTGALNWTLNNPVGMDQDRFGESIAIAGAVVIVGAPETDTTGTGNGAAYAFDRNTGALLDTIAKPPPNGGLALFGQSVAAAGARLYAGGHFGGSAYIFEGLGSAPTAVDDNLAVAEDSQNALLNVLANDIGDLDGMIVTQVTQGAHGQVAISADGKTVEYTPNLNYNGPDSFTYTMTDGFGTDTATISITVTAVNDPPDAKDDEATVLQDSGPNPLAVLANDVTTPDTGETLTITQVTQGANGAVVITGGGTGLTYQPAAGYSGPDSFTYTVSDGNGGTDTATVAITVQSTGGSNNPPDAVADTAILAEDAGPQSIDVLVNDTTEPGETLTVSAVTQGQHGTVAIAPGGTSITYTPLANFAGTDSFLYAVADGRGGADFASVTVTVNNDLADRLEVATSPGTVVFTEGDLPAFIDPGVRVSTNNQGLKKAQVKITSGYVRGRDVLVFTPTHGLKGSFSAATGTLTITGSASTAVYEAALAGVRYRNASPSPVAGVRTIAFTVSDALGTGDPAARLIQVVAVNTSPTLTLTGLPLTFKENGPALAVAGSLIVKDLDNTHLAGASVSVSAGFAAGQDVLTFTPKPGIVGGYDAGTGVLTLTGTATTAVYQAVLRSVKYRNTSDGPTNAPRTLSFTVTDGLNSSAAVTRIVNVVPVNDAPVLDTSGNPALPDVPSGTTNPAGATVADLLGSAVTDPDLGAFQGIAITGLTGTASGNWQFSLDGGTTWTTIATASVTKALLLRSTDKVRFVPVVSGFTGQATISYRAWDQTTGTAGLTAAVGAGGGKTAFSLATETASVNVV